MRTPTFVIVGTPRSGTTLVQRFASQLDGVRVPPETHFFTDFAWSLHGSRSLPLEGDDLRDALEDYRNRDYFRDIAFDVDQLVERLGGRCASMLELYAGLIDHLAGSASVVGEKTPGHLLWWRPLTSAWPRLKVVCVVRDPRAVVASHLQVGWSRHHVMTAQRWRDDVIRVREADATLGRDRCLVLRFEDMLASEDRTRAALAAFLGVDWTPGATSGTAKELFAPWEEWKAAALDPVDPARSDAWRDVLSTRQVREVEAVCHTAMGLMGYRASRDGGSAIVRRAVLPPGAQLRRAQYRLRRYRRERGIARIAAGWDGGRER